MREKAGKVSKTKRRGQAVLEDEDEDLDVLADELDGEEQSTEAMNLSMSLARPPKPHGEEPSAPASGQQQQRSGSSRSAGVRA